MEALRPFLVITKLAPMARDELMASMSPMYLASQSVARRRWRQGGAGASNVLVFDHDGAG